ncbi:MAG: hypothetical protein KAU90_03205, partial [Sulfurovaceae bacterium]|nr:hypothetical protein [Sulfurovaceae bacterium]
TSKNIEIDWSKTLFIRGNQTDGSFMLIGQMYIERNCQKINDVVFANATFEKRIYPSHLV